MTIQKLTLGPMIGSTTAESVRITGRGTLESIWFVGRYKKRSEKIWSETHKSAFPRNINLDHMAGVEFSNLEANTMYDYQCGFITSDNAVDLSIDESWVSIPNHTFKTFVDSSSCATSFIFGSCRNIQKFKNGKFKYAQSGKHGDLTFKNLLNNFPPKKTVARNKNCGIDFVLMGGDQIYADNANAFRIIAREKAKTFKQYCERYHKAFGTTYAAKLLANYPTYMIWDDHEVTNDWPNEEAFLETSQYKDGAYPAYIAYQMMQQNQVVTDIQQPTLSSKLFYTFSSGCSEFFVLNVRSERSFLNGKKGNMLGEEQFSALKTWLTDLQRDKPNSVKFIVSAVPVFPDGGFPYGFRRILEGKDTWSGYKKQRTNLLNYIHDENITKVVFLSGDIHCSLTAKLTHGRSGKLVAYNVISSAFYWQTFGWNDSSLYNERYLKDGDGGKTNYYVSIMNKHVITKHNYTRVICTPNELTVQVYRGHKNHKTREDILDTQKLRFTKSKIS